MVYDHFKQLSHFTKPNLIVYNLPLTFLPFYTKKEIEQNKINLQLLH